MVIYLFYTVYFDIDRFPNIRLMFLLQWNG